MSKGTLLHFPLDRIRRLLKCRWCEWSCPLYHNSKDKPTYDEYGDKIAGWGYLYLHIEDEHENEWVEAIRDMAKDGRGSAFLLDVIGSDHE